MQPSILYNISLLFLAISSIQRTTHSTARKVIVSPDCFAVIFPLCACTVALTMDRPIPVPFTVPECDSSTGLSPPRGSHAALPIACDAFNARTMAIREYHCPACTSSPTSCHTCFTARFDRSAFSYWKASWRTCRTARHRQNVSVCPMMRRYIRAYFSKNCDATDLLLAGKG